MRKLLLSFVLLIFISLVVCEDSNGSISIPTNAADILARIKLTKEQIQSAYQSLVSQELAKLEFATNPSLTSLTQLSTLLNAAANVLNQLQAQVTSIRTALNTAVSDFATTLRSTIGQSSAYKTLVTEFADAHAAVQLECQALRSAVSQAVTSLKEIALEKIQAQIDEQTYLNAALVKLPAIQAALALNARDENAKAMLMELANNISSTRARQLVFENITQVIQQFVQNNQAHFESCLTAVRDNAAALATNIRAAYSDIKTEIRSDYENFKQRVATIVSEAVAEANATVREAHFDDILRSVKLSIEVDIENVSEALRERVKNALEAALRGITNGDVQITLSANFYSGRKRTNFGDLFIANISGTTLNSHVSSLIPNTPSSIETAITRYQSLFNSASVQDEINAIRSKIENATMEEIQAAKESISQLLSTAQSHYEAAREALQSRLSELSAQIQVAREKIFSNSDVRAAILAVKAARDAILERVSAHVNETVADLQARVYRIQSEVESIKSQYKTASENLRTAVESDLRAQLQSQLDALNATISQKAAEFISAQQNLHQANANIVTILANIRQEKAELIQEISASVREIHAQISGANVTAVITTIRETLETLLPEISELRNTVVEAVQNGARLQLSITFNSSEISREKVIAALNSVIGSVFDTDSVSTSVQGGKRSTLEMETVNTDSSVSAAGSSPNSDNNNNSGMNMTGAYIGIAVGVAVALVVAVIVVFVVRSKNSGSPRDHV